MSRLRKVHREKAVPEATIPLINVVFLLLIFFLVAGTLSAPRDGAVELATAETFDPAALDPRAIYIDAAGGYRVGGKASDAARALASVEDGTEPGAAVTVVPDRTLEARRMLSRLAELRGLTERPIRILTRRLPPGGE